MQQSSKEVQHSFQDRVDTLALMYVQNRFDVKSMSVNDFMEVFCETSNSIEAFFKGHE